MFSRKLNNAGFRVLLVDNRDAEEQKAFPFSLEDIAEDIRDLVRTGYHSVAHINSAISMGE